MMLPAAGTYFTGATLFGSESPGQIVLARLHGLGRCSAVASAISAMIFSTGQLVDVAQAAKDDTVLISRAAGPNGAKGNNNSFSSESISHDGRYILFDSNATNLSPDDSDATTDVFLRDTATNTLTLVSRASGSSGAKGNSFSYGWGVSSSGRFVVFVSGATNLSDDDTDATADVFVRDLATNATTLVSRATGAAGAKGNGASSRPAISADGRMVAFATESTNMSSDDSDATADLFVRDTQENTTTLISRATGANGAKGDGVSDESPPSLSSDGRMIAFTSESTNLTADDTDAGLDVFLRDTQTGTTSLVSRATGSDGANGFGFDPSISADGRYIAFAGGDVGTDASGIIDVFVRDTQADTTSLVSRASGAAGTPGNSLSLNPAVSASGRYVAFDFQGTNLSPDDTEDFFDVYVRDRQSSTTTLVSRASGAKGVKGSGFGPAISGDGRFTTYSSEASNLSADDTDVLRDVFAREVLGPPPPPSPPPPPPPPPPPAPPAAAPPAPVSPSAAPPAASPQPPPVSGPSVLGEPPFASKLEVARARVLRSDRRLSVLAPITGRASGEVQAAFQAAGSAERFMAEVDASKRRVRIDRRIPAAQARLGTGILTLTYKGDENTQPQEVRLRAASRRANLDANRPKIAGNRLTASGRISKKARGVVRLQVLYEPEGMPTRTLTYTARIKNGRYAFDQHLPDDVVAEIAKRRGVVHSYTLFTGYFPRRVRGEMRSYQVLGER